MDSANLTAPDSVRTLGQLGPVSALGIGSFAGEPTDADDALYVSATTDALKQGITLVDTSINYRSQRSERAIGKALRDWRNGSSGGSKSASDRAHVTVCTRGGYIPLEAPAPASKTEYRNYVEREYFNSGIIHPDELVAGGHCIAPTFMSDQIARSRANLGVDVIDLYYLHNPEQQLDGVSRDVFTQRLRDAFSALEACMGVGAIRAYGCATWHGLRVGPDAPNHLSLEALVNTAYEVAGDDHHFAAVQLPINLAMSEAVRVPTQMVKGQLRTVLEAASELGVSVVACAPLMHGKLAEGLPDEVRAALPAAPTDAGRALNFVRTLPGVTSTVVGMRSLAHVEENVALLSAAPALD